MSTYVYGITHADRRLPEDIEGVGDPPRPVRAVRSGDLMALCSDVPAGRKPKPRDLLAHQRVVLRAGTDGPVVPLPFGEVSPDDDTVAAVLDERHDRYVECLKSLDGKDEFHVEVHHDEEAARQAVLADDEEVTPRTLVDRARSDAALVEEQLAAHAASVRYGPGARRVRPAEPAFVADLSFLVERDGQDDFLAAVRRLHLEHEHLLVQATGPLPPYSFGPATRD
ncbi:GvpL/GvpF family gas vesicle protein [Streptomyces sp. NPDC053493]|uniref:GvpL/GvpF family gas vesicle protein n=1 Tax=Streptomyces sp. NPDC053493 TaxID=3365705 RepID=UPI0037D88190